MAGVDNIVTEILRQAQESADALLAEAREKADQILKDGASADEKMTASLLGNAEKSAAELAQRAVSQGALRKRQALLKAKQEIIDEVIGKAYASLASQKDEAYFSMIRTLVEKAVRSGEGKICFNETDLKRIPEGFAREIAQIAAKKNGTLTLSPDPVKIKSGFILSYGGIEENCSLDAIFAEKKDALRDLANSVLW